MVVGGLPEENPIHAECVANQALDMMYYCKQVIRPDSTEPIQVLMIISPSSLFVFGGPQSYTMWDIQYTCVIVYILIPEVSGVTVNVEVL